MQRPSSNVPASSFATATPTSAEVWNGILRDAYSTNYAASGKIGTGPASPEASLSVTDASGQPHILSVSFSGFLNSDPRIVIFNISINDLSTMRTSSSHAVLWRMPRTRQRFSLYGKAYSVTSPILTHRYGGAPRSLALPPSHVSLDPEDFWEEKRHEFWHTLGPIERARFSWPSSGAPKEKIPKDRYAMKLEAMDKAMPKSNSLTNLTPHADPESLVPNDADATMRWIHNSALDNFCLLLLKVSRVDYGAPSLDPTERDERWLYECNNKDNTWTRTELNA